MRVVSSGTWAGLFVALVGLAALLGGCSSGTYSAPAGSYVPSPGSQMAYTSPLASCVSGTAVQEANSVGLNGAAFSVYDTNSDEAGGCFTNYEKAMIDEEGLIKSEGLVSESILDEIPTVYPTVGPLTVGALKLTYAGWKKDRQAYLKAALTPPAFFSHGQLGLYDVALWNNGEELPGSLMNPADTIFAPSKHIVAGIPAGWNVNGKLESFITLFHGVNCSANVEQSAIQSTLDTLMNVSDGAQMAVRNGWPDALRVTRTATVPRVNGPLNYTDADIVLLYRRQPDDKPILNSEYMTFILAHQAPATTGSYTQNFTTADLPALGTIVQTGQIISYTQLIDPGRQLNDFTMVPGAADYGGVEILSFGPATYHVDSGGNFTTPLYSIIDPFAWPQYNQHLGWSIAPTEMDRYSQISTFEPYCQ